MSARSRPTTAAALATSSRWLLITTAALLGCAAFVERAGASPVGVVGGAQLRDNDEQQLASLAIEPSDQTAVVGTTVILPCRISNLQPGGLVQWTRDGIGLGRQRALPHFNRYRMIGSDEESDYSLRIDGVTLDDDGLYECQVHSPGDHRLRSKPARLTVILPPDVPFLQPGSEVVVTAGKKLTLICHSSGGKPEPDIMWYDTNGSLLLEDQNISYQVMDDQKRILAKSEITIIPTPAHDGGYFTCSTQNQAITTPLSTKVQIFVQYPPQIQLEQSSGELFAGTEASITCNVAANPSDNVTYKWFKDEESLDVNLDTKTLPLGILTRQHDGAKYTCEATNEIGSTNKTKNLSVKYAPEFVSTPSSVSADVGNSVVIPCRVRGNPKPTVIWTHLVSGDVVGYGEELRLVANQATAGQYSCLATSEISQVTAQLNIWLRGPPHIAAAQTLSVYEGDHTSIDCNIVSVPHPNLTTWLRNGVEIIPDGKRILIEEDLQSDGITSKLMFDYTTGDDFTTYTCSVKNVYGEASKNITLKKSFPLVGWAGVGGAVVILLIIVCTVCCVVSKRSDATVLEKENSKSAKSLDHCANNSSATVENGISNTDPRSLPPIISMDTQSMGKDSESKDCGRTVSSMSVEDRDSLAAWDSDRGSSPRRSLELQHVSHLHTPKHARERQPPITVNRRRLSETTIIGPDEDHLTEYYNRGWYPHMVMLQQPQAPNHQHLLQQQQQLPYERTSLHTLSSDPSGSLPSSQAPPAYSLSHNGHGSTAGPHHYKDQLLTQVPVSAAVIGSGRLHSAGHPDYGDIMLPPLKLIREDLITDKNAHKDMGIDKNKPIKPLSTKYILPSRTTLKPGTLV